MQGSIAVQMAGFHAILRPADVAQLNQAIARILKKPEVQERLRNDGMEAAHNTPEEFSRFIARDIAKWSKVVKTGNIKVD